MQSELYHNIMGEPEALKNILTHRRERFQALGQKYKDVRRIYVVGSGTSYHAGLAAKGFMEQVAGVEVTTCYPTIFRQMQHFPDPPALCVGISQSGISAVTVESVKQMAQMGYWTVAISAHSDSPLKESCEDYIPLVVGEERSASTMGYVASIVNLYMLALSIGESKGMINESYTGQVLEALERHITNFPALVRVSEDWVRRNMEELKQAVKISVMGYEENYATALEGALKLLEAVRVMVAGYEFEEWLHGGYNALRSDSYLVLCRGCSKTDNRERLDRMVETVQPYTKKVYVIGGTSEENPRHLVAPFSNIPYIAPLEFILPFQMMIALLPHELGIDADRVLIPGFHQMVGSKL